MMLTSSGLKTIRTRRSGGAYPSLVKVSPSTFLPGALFLFNVPSTVMASLSARGRSLHLSHRSPSFWP